MPESLYDRLLWAVGRLRRPAHGGYPTPEDAERAYWTALPPFTTPVVPDTFPEEWTR